MAFKYYTPLTVTSNSSLLPSTQTNFQLLLKYTDARLKSVANSGHVESGSGFDIRPYSGDGATALDFELVSYTASTGAVQMWVNVPSLSLGLGLVLKYGDTTLTSDGSNKTNVWKNNGYICVYHHEQATAANAPDSSGNGNTATVASGSPTSAAGQIDNGISVNGDWYTTPQSAFGTNSALTWQGWFKPAALQTSITAFGKEDNASNTDFTIRQPASVNAWAVDCWSGGVRGNVPGTTAISTGTWYFVVGTYDGANVRLYVNGAAEGTAAALTGNVQNTVAATINMGVNPSIAGWDGTFDEIHLANVARSANWITAEYNNQLNPTTFVALGTEVQLIPQGVPKDWPNPTARAFPLENRTWLQPLDLTLRSKDKFFDAPGQGPTYDWPNPRGKPYPIEVRTWIQTLVLTLFGKDKFFSAPGQGPSYDWTNPNGPRRGIDLYGFTQQFNPNLQIIAPPRPPINQTDWPNPLIPRRHPDFAFSTNPNLYQSGKPFKFDDYQNPLPYRRPVQDWILQSNLNLLVPFVQRDWPNPLPHRRPHLDVTLSSNPNIYQSGKPFKQEDYPNPPIARQPSETRSYTLATNPNIYASGKPFKQDDWQNPRGALRANPDWTASTALNLLVPFNQRDWPNPIPYAPRPHFTLATNPNIYPSGKPFKQDDFPNPLIARQPAETRGFTLSTNPAFYPTGPVQNPFYQTDWPNPRAAGQSIDNRTWLEPLNPLQLGKDQFFTTAGRGPVYDYPNPRGAARGIDLWNFTATPSVLFYGRPFSQTDWPNPTRATVRRPDWTQITDPNRYASGKPFKRDDWQNPLGPRRKPDLNSFLLARNFEFFPSGQQLDIQDTPTIANVIGLSNSAFLLLVAGATATAQAGLESQAQILSASSTVNAPRSVRTNLIIFTANDKKVGD